MKIIKLKGIVIKEVTFGDNDKILTVLTDKLGKISCMAKGAKKTNSSLLAPCQSLVYSEFLLYQGTSFYHINSAEVISTFYNLRTDLDKIKYAFELCKIINNVMYEGEDSSNILSLFLNTLYMLQQKEVLNLQNSNIDNICEYEFIQNIFKLKLMQYLGYMPNVFTCNECKQDLVKLNCNTYHYSYMANMAICDACYMKLDVKDKKEYIRIDKAIFYAICYILASDVKKIFSFNLEEKAKIEFSKIVESLFKNM